MTMGEMGEMVAKGWCAAGFAAKEVAPWWVAQCHDPFRAAELRDAGVDPAELARLDAYGKCIGHHYAHGRLTVDEVLEMIADARKEATGDDGAAF